MNQAGPVWIMGYCHLFFFGLLLPYAAVRLARKLENRDYLPRPKYFTSVIAQQAFFILLSLLVARAEGVKLFSRPYSASIALLIGAVVLLAMVASMFPQWRRKVIEQERGLYYFMPRTRSEKFQWALISLCAGFGEELTYRGVMFILLWRLTGVSWMAALMAAGVFAFSHFMQGWKAIGFIFGFAFSFQAVYLLTGSLLTGMAVHFVYDLIAGFAYSHLAEKYDYPIAGIAPEKKRGGDDSVIGDPDPS